MNEVQLLTVFVLDLFVGQIIISHDDIKLTFSFHVST